MTRKLSRSLWLTATILGLSPGVSGQTDIMEGGHVVIASGGTLTSMVTINIASGGKLINNGMLCLRRDLHNQNAGPDNLGPGVFNFCGEVSQTVSGNNILGSLLMDNPAGLSLGGPIQVLGMITLANGRITLGLYNLTLGMQAVVAGNPSASSMIIATSTGELRKEFSGPGTFLFPVGDGDAMPEYSPVSLTFAAGSGSFPPGNHIGVSLINTPYPDPNITGSYLKRYWNLSNAGMTGFSCTVNFWYTDADIVGDEDLIVCARPNPLPWTLFEPANVTANILTATGITYFSTPGSGNGLSSFTGLTGTTVPANLQLTNMTIEPGHTDCYAATQVLTVGGNGGSFVVMAGGEVDLIAGQVIAFQPLAVVTSGGRLHAWISPGGPYCNPTMNALVANASSAVALAAVSVPSSETFVRIYPNPAVERITIEFPGKWQSSFVDLVIYNMNGLPVYTRTGSDGSRIQVSLDGWPAGIFMVRARSGNRSGQAKIVRLPD